MAMETVDTLQTIQFSDMLHVRAQQMNSRLRDKCQMRRFSGDVWAYDGLGVIEARENATRTANSTFDDIEFNRRKLTRREFVVTLGIDQYDVEGMLSDPQGALASACMKAMERKVDKVIYQAMFADVRTGRDFENTTTFANDGGRTVDATGGLTEAKLLEVWQNFIDDEVINEEEKRVWAGISGKEHTTLLGLQKVTSRDYSSQFALEKGTINQAIGINLIKFGANSSTVILEVTGGGTIRNSFAMVEGAMVLGIGRDMQITVKDRPDKVNVRQVQVTMVLGAVRSEGKLISKFNFAA